MSGNAADTNRALPRRSGRTGGIRIPAAARVKNFKSAGHPDEIRLVSPQTATTDALVVEHLPLVGYHVNAMLGRVPASVSRAELASAGALALVQAARAYDPETGVPFERYAALRIRGALVDELRGMDWLSRGARRRARQLGEVSDQLTSHLGRIPTRAELATALGVGEDEVEAARGDAEVKLLSIDGFDTTVADMVLDSGPGPEASVLANEQLRYLTAGVEALPERLRYVIEQLFFADRPVVELAEELGVTQSRISQLRTEALTLLRDGMNASLDPELVPQAARPDGVAERRRRAYFASVAAKAANNGTAAVVPHQRPGAHDAPQFAEATYERIAAVG